MPRGLRWLVTQLQEPEGRVLAKKQKTKKKKKKPWKLYITAKSGDQTNSYTW